MRYLTLREVLELYYKIMERTGGSTGVQNLGALESALAQPRMSFAGEELYPTLIEKASALGFTLIKNHPFWDGNGRIARLLANVPLLKSGLPPIVIPKEKRREYIQLIAAYQMSVGQLDNKSGARHEPQGLKDFEAFCLECYQETETMIAIR